MLIRAYISIAIYLILLPFADAEAKSFKHGELLIKFKKGITRQRASDIHQKAGAYKMQTAMKSGIERVLIQGGASAEESLEYYRGLAEVQYAEPNYFRRIQATPDDPGFYIQWALHNVGQSIGGPYSNPQPGVADNDIDAPDAWDIETGSNEIVIAVVDTGVDYEHIDIKDNMWLNTGETCGNALDDDLNGYVDDCMGWNFVDGNSDPKDDNGIGHGTHVAGIIGAAGSNSTGVSGIMWAVSIMPLKILKSDGYGTVFDEILAIEYAASNGARVINSSLGGEDFSQFEYDAIKQAGDAGVLFVAASGNFGSDNGVAAFYPASHALKNIISVAASDFNMGLAWFSNFGTNIVHIAAPGEDIYSTLPHELYGFQTGTSMSAGFVSGTAGLLMTYDGGLTALEAKELMTSTATPLGFDVLSGGMLNAYSSLSATMADIKPTAPSHFSAKEQDGSGVLLNWLDESSVEDSYRVMRKTGNSDYELFGILDADAESYIDASASISEGSFYSYKIITENQNGASESAGAVISVPPNAPYNLSAKALSDSVIRLAWIDNSVVEDLYVVEMKTEDSDYQYIAQTGADSSAIDADGLSENKTYYFRVAALSYITGKSGYSNEAQALTKVHATSKSGCFIATAAFGDENAKEVLVFRRFRDRYLTTSKAGSALAQMYYRHSPPAADFIARHEALRRVVRAGLHPASLIVDFALLKHPYPLCLAICAFTALVYYKGSNRTRRRKPGHGKNT